MDSSGIRPFSCPVNEMIRDAGVNNGISLDGLIVIGTIVDGVFILNPDGSLREHLNTAHFMQNNTVLALRKAKGHAFWAGLDRGIDYISLDNPLSIYMDPTGSRRAVYAAALTGDRLWVGTNQGVFRYRYDPFTGYSDPLLVEGTQGQVWDLEVIDGDLYCGHTNGTFLIRDGQVQKDIRYQWRLRDPENGNQRSGDPSSKQLQRLFSLYPERRPMDIFACHPRLLRANSAFRTRSIRVYLGISCQQRSLQTAV